MDLHKKFAYWTLINRKHQILWQGKVVTEQHATLQALTQLPVATPQCRAVIEPVEQ
jgi:hypothetical protein